MGNGMPTMEVGCCPQAVDEVVCVTSRCTGHTQVNTKHTARCVCPTEVGLLRQVLPGDAVRQTPCGNAMWIEISDCPTPLATHEAAISHAYVCK